MNYTVKILWKKNNNELFIDNKYSRVHEWIFDGGSKVLASSSPEIVPIPMSDEKAVDPEEAFIASISSCHMLFFLAIAAKKRLIVDKYEDNPVGIMVNNDEGKKYISKVTLHPRIQFGTESKPSQDTIHKIHELAHKECFIAHSVKSEITIE